MFKFKNVIFPLIGALAIIALSGCQVRPLNAPSTVAQLRNVSVAPVDTRVAQQVRNNILFGIQGGRGGRDGQGSTGARYKLALEVTSSVTNVIIRQISGEPAASNVKVIVDYRLTDSETNQVISKGKRSGTAAFDKTTQRFANLRAEIDAENRAAKEVAEQIRIAIATKLNAQ